MPKTPVYTHGFDFDDDFMQPPSTRPSFSRGEGCEENQNQSQEPAVVLQPPPTDRPRRQTQLPARLRDPDVIVELPGQATPAELPPELINAINLISDPDINNWKKLINRKHQTKAIRERQLKINLIANYKLILDNLDEYRRNYEPEPKWSTQQWVNFILTGDPHEYRTIDLTCNPPVETHQHGDVAIQDHQPVVPMPAPQGPEGQEEDEPEAVPPSRSLSNDSNASNDEFFSPPVSPVQGSSSSFQSYPSSSQSSQPTPAGPAPAARQPSTAASALWDDAQYFNPPPSSSPPGPVAPLPSGNPVPSVFQAVSQVFRSTRSSTTARGQKLPDSILSSYPDKKRKK